MKQFELVSHLEDGRYELTEFNGMRNGQPAGYHSVGATFEEAITFIVNHWLENIDSNRLLEIPMTYNPIKYSYKITISDDLLEYNRICGLKSWEKSL